MIAPYKHRDIILSMCNFVISFNDHTNQCYIDTVLELEQYRKIYNPVPGASLITWCHAVIASNAIYAIEEEKRFVDREHYSDYYTIEKPLRDPDDVFDMSTIAQSVFVIQNCYGRNCLMVIASNDPEDVDMASKAAEAFNLFNSFVTEGERK